MVDFLWWMISNPYWWSEKILQVSFEISGYLHFSAFLQRSTEFSCFSPTWAHLGRTENFWRFFEEINEILGDLSEKSREIRSSSAITEEALKNLWKIFSCLRRNYYSEKNKRSPWGADKNREFSRELSISCIIMGTNAEVKSFSHFIRFKFFFVHSYNL